MMIHRFYVIPLRDGLGQSSGRAAVSRLAEADRYAPSLVNTSAAFCIDADQPTIIWESSFVRPEARADYLKDRYHATVIDRYLLPDSPQRIGHLYKTSSYGFDADPSTYLMERGFRRLVLLRLTADADPQALARAVHGAPMLTSAFAANSHQRRNWTWRPFRWTHIWAQGFSTQSALVQYLRGNSKAAALERSGFEGFGVEMSAAYIYPVASRPRTEIRTPNDHSGEPLLQTFTVQVKPSNVRRYLELLADAYDPAVARAGMRLESRWVSSGELGELVTVQSTWSTEQDEAYRSVRDRLLDDEQWWTYSAEAEALIENGSREMGYSVTRADLI